MYVNTNVSALNAWNNLDQTQQKLSNVLEQLSSGNRINSAANDPAGLAISQQMLSEINGMQQGYQNTQSGMSLLQTSDGALGQVQNILQSMRSLASEAAGGTMNTTDTQALQSEMNQYAQEITSITNQTQFNSMNLLGGTLTSTTFQIGPDQGQTLGISIGAADAYSLGVTGQTANITTAGQSATAITGLANMSNDPYTLAASVTPWNVSLGTGTTADFTSLGAAGAVTLTSADTFTVTVGTAGTSSVTASISLYDSATGTTQTYTSAAPSATTSSFSVNIGGSSFTLVTNTATTSAAYTATLNPTKTQFVLTDTNTSTSSTLSVNGVISSGTAENMSFGSGTNTGSLNFTTSTSVYSLTDATYTQTGTTAPTVVTQPTATDFTASLSGSAAAGTNGTLTTQAVASTAVDITNQQDAQAALTVLTNAITKVSTLRSNVGAYQNRLQFAGSDLQISQTNLQSARAGITNADMALEMAKLSQYQILQQSGVAMLAQANQIPQALLKLLN